MLPLVVIIVLGSTVLVGMGMTLRKRYSGRYRRRRASRAYDRHHGVHAPSGRPVYEERDTASILPLLPLDGRTRDRYQNAGAR